jgi:hypothetical protein
MSRSRIKASSTIQISSPGVYKYHVSDAHSCSSPSKHALKSRSKKGNSHHYVLSSLCGGASSFFPLLKTQIATHYVSVSAPALRTKMRHARLHVFWWRLSARYISLRQVGILRAFCSVRLWPHSLNLERKLQNSPVKRPCSPLRSPRSATRGVYFEDSGDEDRMSPSLRATKSSSNRSCPLPALGTWIRGGRCSRGGINTSRPLCRLCSPLEHPAFQAY